MQLKKALALVVIFGSLFYMIGTVWGQTYYVQPGDSLYKIAARYGTTVDALRRANRLGNSGIYPGQALSISSGSLGAGAATRYTVRSGDTLFLVASKYGVTVSALKQANGISGNSLWVGQTLRIPAKSGASISGNNSYTVQKGDTLFLIARRYGITVESLLGANNLSYGKAIYPGLRLTIPRGSGGSSTNYYNFNLKNSDLDLLARLVTAESGGESFEGQVAVASTILNRLRDPRYPKTVPSIIYQIDNGRYQYSPVLDGRINLPASSSAYRAVQAAIKGWDPSNGANGFFNPGKTDSRWVRSHPVTAVIGDHVFFSY